MIGRVWKACLAAGGLRTWAIIAAAPILTGYACWLTWAVWKGPWVIARQGQQLDILGWALWGALILIALILIALTGLGVAATITKGGLTLNVGDDDHAPAATVTTTTETTIKPGDGS